MSMNCCKLVFVRLCWQLPMQSKSQHSSELCGFAACRLRCEIIEPLVGGIGHNLGQVVEVREVEI